MRVKHIRAGVIVVALGLLSAAFLIGQAKGQGKKHPYLPDKFSEPYVPTVLEWRIMNFNAHSGSLGQSFKRLSVDGAILYDYVYRLRLILYVFARYPSTLQSFQALPDRDQRAELSEIAKEYLGSARLYLDDAATTAQNLPSEIEDGDVEIWVVHQAGERLGIWRNGEILLPGEKGFG